MINRLFGLISAFLLFTVLFIFNGKLFCFHEKGRVEVEGSILPKDKMQEAMQFEFELTKDPATGTVPRERLLQAKEYTQLLQDRQRSGRFAAAIAGVTWTERGPNNIGGRTRAILVDPNDATQKSVFSASVGGGLWKTTDITATNPVWIPVDDFFNNIAITSLASDPLSAPTIYFGTGEGFFNADAIRGLGIWKSINGGTSFSQLASTNNSNFYYVIKIVVHPATSHVFAATRTGVYKSKDGGTTWTKVLGSGVGAASDMISDLEIAADGSVWVGIGVGTTDGVYRAPATGATSGDAATYTKMNTGANGFPTTGFDRLELACAPNNAAVVYVLSESTATGDLFNIYKTTNSGVAWTAMTLPVDADGGVTPGFTRTQAWYDLIAAVDPLNANTVFIGGVDLFKSTNGGTSWTQISHWYGGFSLQDVHADQHAIVFEPGNSNVVYFGNDGGIWRSGDGASAIPTIVSKDNTYDVTQFYGCAIHPTLHTDYFLAGAQDNGSHQFSSAGVNSTIEVTGGDGCFCHIDQDQPQFQWTSYVYNNYYRSTNSGVSWTSVNFGNTGSFVNPTDYDNASNVMYTGISAGNYQRWTDPQTGSTVATIGISAFNGGTVRHISVSPNTPNRVFFGMSNGRVVRVDNANTIASGSPGILVGTPTAGNVTCIAFEPGNDNHILVTYGNYGLTSVYESTNALGATPTFTAVEGNLPDMPVRWALFNPSNNTQAMIATEVGVWTTDLLNGAATVWGPSNTGLANVRVDMLQYRTSDNMVIAATHGRGLFSTDAFVTTPFCEFSATPKVQYIGMPVQFTDGSLKAVSWAWDFGDGNTSSTKSPTHAYATAGLYTVTLVINGNAAYTRTKTNIVQVLPNRGTPYTVAGGAAGSFDINAIEFGSDYMAGTFFERGNSAIAGKNGVVSGTSAWVTSLAATTYVDNTTSYLYCPNFNLTAGGTYTLSFYGKWSCESNYDGFNVEYSLNKGLTWTVLGASAAGWYNFANAAGGSAFPTAVAFFTGTISTYTKYSKDVSFLAGNSNVAFRFVFKSDPSVDQAGVALDNFEITGATNIPLPVKLLSFIGKNNHDRNELEWATSTEINNEGFDVERSVNGISFDKIGFVNGNGNSSVQINYTFTDDKLSLDKYFYRLKQTDYDGRYAYSATIVILSGKGTEPFLLFPNPFKDHLYLLLKGRVNELNYSIFNSEGKLITSESIKNPFETISISNGIFAPGIYFIRIDVDGEEYLKKVLMQ